MPVIISGRRHLPFLLLLFFGSGCAALIYEIVWFQLLQFVIGSSAVSLAVLLGTFMGGMCLGSLLLPRLAREHWHPFRVYGALEGSIGMCGFLVLVAMPAVGHLYTSMVGHGMPGIILRALVCIACLLPPTTLMGATLPAIARGVERSPQGIAWLGFFYGGNTLGAVAGCLAAGFYLLRVHDIATATYCAVLINAIVAVLAFALARTARPMPLTVAAAIPTAINTRVDNSGATDEPGGETLAAADDSSRASISDTSGGVLVAIALSGLCALGAEVVWTRNLSLLLGATVYTFSIILAVFLVGLGIGSSVGAAIGRTSRSPRIALALCQLLQVAAITWAAYVSARSLPYWPVDTSLHATAFIKFQLDLVRCAWAILPATLLWGASFPLALASLSRGEKDPAPAVARVYAANTVGAIVGAIAASLVFIPWIGTQHTQQLLLALSVAAASAALYSSAARPTGVLGLGAAVAAAAMLAMLLPQIPWELVAYGRQIATTDYGARLLYFGEGMNASVAVSETPGGARFFHVSGKTEASSLAKDMRLQRMLGHIPALLHPNPKSVLIVGCGAGVTAGSFVLHPSIERIVICDIEPLIPGVVAQHFATENYNVVRDRRVQIVYDDARHFVGTTQEKFDIITSDPIHPWVKGSAVLYSQEYFELCRLRLNPGGFVTQWVPFYEADRAVVQSQIATFFAAFPHGTIWGNDDEGVGYDTVMLGQAGPLQIDVDAVQRRLDRDDHVGVRSSLAGLGLGSAVELLSTYAGRQPDLKPWLAGAQLNRDRNLRLQYLAGLQLNSNNGTSAYGEMLGYRRFPDDIFVASQTRLAVLRQNLTANGSK